MRLFILFSGGGGIRTRGTSFEVRRFSKPVVSATHPLHLADLKTGLLLLELNSFRWLFVEDFSTLFSERLQR